MDVTQPIIKGTKRQCPKCQSKFYDMAAVEIHCPRCDYVFPIHLTPRETPLDKPVPRRMKRAAAEERIEGMGDVVELEELDDDYADIGHLEEVEDHHEYPDTDINGDDAEDDMFIDEIGEDDIHIVDDPDMDELDYDEAATPPQ